jgi:hypothetical protein
MEILATPNDVRYGSKGELVGTLDDVCFEPLATCRKRATSHRVYSFGPPWARSVRSLRAAGGLGHEPAKLLRLPGVGLHLLLGKTALQSQDVLQIFSFGQLVS